MSKPKPGKKKKPVKPVIRTRSGKPGIQRKRIKFQKRRSLAAMTAPRGKLMQKSVVPVDVLK